jgi:hypothetical protein
MAQAATNKGKFKFANGDIVPGTTDLRLGLLKTCANVATSAPDINFITDMEAHADFAEITVSGYARQALTSEAATEDDANDRANIDSDNVTFSALATGETVVGAFLFIHTGSDATASVIAIYDLTSTPTNGGDITITISDFLRLV